MAIKAFFLHRRRKFGLKGKKMCVDKLVYTVAICKHYHPMDVGFSNRERGGYVDAKSALDSYFWGADACFKILLGVAVVT